MKFLIEGQNIRLESIQRNVVSDSIDFIDCHFQFGAEWAEMTCVAQFTQGNTTYNQLLDEAGGCKFPAELVAGQVAISVFGQIAGLAVRATTKPYMLELKASGFVSDGDTAIPPTADLYSQLLATIDSTLKGEDGADGADGAAGDTGPAGADGQDGQDGLTTSITMNDESYTVDGDGNIDLGAVATMSNPLGVGTGIYQSDELGMSAVIAAMFGILSQYGSAGITRWYEMPVMFFGDTNLSPYQMLLSFADDEDGSQSLYLWDVANSNFSPVATHYDIAEAEEAFEADLVSTYTQIMSEVDTKIAAAIGTALGGSY